ncbi:hypothetical protein ACFO0M_17170 [Micromonospora mangrovi]|uniref:Uncharacterized protein n=2 Tax=Micromonospora TaxID=1873 RepID=A0AAU7MDS9_9ACTN
MAYAQHGDTDQQASKAAYCATRLDRNRADLDTGTDPAIVSRWIAEVQAGQVAAEATLRRWPPGLVPASAAGPSVYDVPLLLGDEPDPLWDAATGA